MPRGHPPLRPVNTTEECYLMGLEPNEIACQLGYAEKTVKVFLAAVGIRKPNRVATPRAARLKLRRQIEADFQLSQARRTARLQEDISAQVDETASERKARERVYNRGDALKAHMF